MDDLDFQYQSWAAERSINLWKQRYAAELGFAAAKKANVPPAQAAAFLKTVLSNHTQDDLGQAVYVMQIARWMVRRNKTIEETRYVYGGYLNIFGEANVVMTAELVQHLEKDGHGKIYTTSGGLWKKFSIDTHSIW